MAIPFTTRDSSAWRRVNGFNIFLVIRVLIQLRLVMLANSTNLQLSELLVSMPIQIATIARKHNKYVHQGSREIPFLKNPLEEKFLFFQHPELVSLTKTCGRACISSVNIEAIQAIPSIIDYGIDSYHRLRWQPVVIMTNNSLPKL